MADDYAYEVDDQGSHVLVTQRGRLPDVETARRLQAEVERALEHRDARLALFDNRATDAPDPEVRQAMFDWAIGETFDRVALLVEGELVAIRATMESLASGRRLKAFNDTTPALQWLLTR